MVSSLEILGPQHTWKGERERPVHLREGPPRESRGGRILSTIYMRLTVALCVCVNILINSQSSLRATQMAEGRLGNHVFAHVARDGCKRQRFRSCGKTFRDSIRRLPEDQISPIRYRVPPGDDGSPQPHQGAQCRRTSPPPRPLLAKRGPCLTPERLDPFYLVKGQRREEAGKLACLLFDSPVPAVLLAGHVLIDNVSPVAEYVHRIIWAELETLDLF